MHIKNLFLCFTLGLICCNKPQSKTSIKLIDLKGYFLKEASRLQKQNTPIHKTVTQNGITETKNISVIKWVNELSLFIESDINKPAWENSYLVKKSNRSIQYIALDTNLKTRKIVVIQDLNQKIIAVEITNQTKNILYSSEERLKYIADSVYQIDKSQHILLIGDTQYKIEGQF